jgi:hypothetical protein
VRKVAVWPWATERSSVSCPECQKEIERRLAARGRLVPKR